MTELNNKLEKEIAKYSASFMSDSKWRKFFQALIAQKVGVKEFNLKYVGDETVRKGSGYLFEVNYEVTFTDNGFKDPGVGGPALFKEIEWIEFKDNLAFNRRHSDPVLSFEKRIQRVDSIKNLLDALGNFEYDLNRDSIRLYGYK